MIKDFPYKNEIYVVHTHAYEDAKELRGCLLKARWSHDTKYKSEIGTTVGSHVGPGLVGAGSGKRKKMNKIVAFAAFFFCKEIYEIKT